MLCMRNVGTAKPVKNAGREDPPSLQPPHGFGSTSGFGAASGGWMMEGENGEARKEDEKSMMEK